MKTTFLGTLLVILTILSSTSFAQNRSGSRSSSLKECENLDREACNLLITGKTVLQNQQSWFSWNTKFFAPVSINESISLNSAEIVGQKVFNLDEKAKIEGAPDTGSSRVLKSGYLKVLAMTKDRTKILVEHIQKNLEDSQNHINFGRRSRGEERTEATEVFFIEASDLKHMNVDAHESRLY